MRLSGVGPIEYPVYYRLTCTMGSGVCSMPQWSTSDTLTNSQLRNVELQEFKDDDLAFPQWSDWL